MNGKIAASSVIDFIITTSTAFIALLSVEGVDTLTDVPQAAMISAVLGGLVAAAKGFKTYTADAPK